jgi:uroporphyrinogen decarboxylase
LASDIKINPDYTQFVKTLKRTGRPSHLTFYEHVASPMFVSERTGKPYYKMSPKDKEYWQTLVDFFLGMGYDYIPMEVSLNLKLGQGHGGLSEGSEARIVIQTWEDFEKYPWPDESNPIEFSYFETVAELLPDGAKICGGAGAGPYEWVSWMLGTIGISYLLMDNPDLVAAVFEKVGRLEISAHRQLAQMDAVCALRQGDDLGFKTSTFLSPDDLRKYVFPIYKQMVAEAHKNDKPFLYHSCGNLAEVYDDLIDDCKIDAKHSFEDTILPVSEFKKLYGDRVTPVGGLDVDFICRRSKDEIREYTRKVIENCFYDGFYVLGTGNSLTDYMPVENYMVVIEEGLKVTS